MVLFVHCVRMCHNWFGDDVQTTHPQCGQQLLSPAETDEELTETAAFQHSKDGGQQLRHQQDWLL